jgi:hypothetical protein
MSLGSAIPTSDAGSHTKPPNALRLVFLWKLILRTQCLGARSRSQRNPICPRYPDRAVPRSATPAPTTARPPLMTPGKTQLTGNHEGGSRKNGLVFFLTEKKNGLVWGVPRLPHGPQFFVSQVSDPLWAGRGFQWASIDRPPIILLFDARGNACLNPGARWIINRWEKSVNNPDLVSGELLPLP